jgi:hypothetical protein
MQYIVAMQIKTRIAYESILLFSNRQIINRNIFKITFDLFYIPVKFISNFNDMCVIKFLTITVHNIIIMQESIH